MARCPVCETENTDDTVFCKKCGIRMSAALEADRRVKLNPIQCPVCQSENSADTVFCKKCGLQISEDIVKDTTHTVLLIRCPKCNQINPIGTKYCGSCGQPLTQETADQVTGQRASTAYIQPVNEGKSSGMPVAKLCLGIISIIISLLISLQACTLLVSNALVENGRTNASSGILLAFFLLIAGIIAIAARRSRGGAVAATILYGMAGCVGAVTSLDGYQDIAIWTALCAILWLIFFISIFAQNYEK